LPSAGGVITLRLVIGVNTTGSIVASARTRLKFSGVVGTVPVRRAIPGRQPPLAQPSCSCRLQCVSSPGGSYSWWAASAICYGYIAKPIVCVP
jgi:hypothetical protein